MNARGSIVTTLTLLALAAPVAQANIPSDHDGVWLGTAHSVKSQQRVPVGSSKCSEPYVAHSAAATRIGP